MSALFPHDLLSLESIAFPDPTINSWGPSPWSQFAGFKALSDELRSDGKLVEADCFGLLAVVMGFHSTFAEQHTPYRPMVIMDGRRSPLPEDLVDQDLIALDALAKKIDHPVVLARIFDVLWIRTKIWEHTVKAAEKYLESATAQLREEEHRHLSADSFLRGLQLARITGTKRDLFGNVKQALVTEIGNHAEDEDYCPHSLMQVYVLFQSAQDATVITTAEALATKARANNDGHKERAYWELAKILHFKNQDEQAAKECDKQIGKSYVECARSAAERTGPSFMAASADLARGIESLTRGGEDKIYLDELKSRLTEYQSKISGELHTYTVSCDITKYATKVQEHLSGQTLQEALLRFAYGTTLSDPVAIRNSVKETAGKHPMIFLHGASLLDDAGRVTKRTEGLWNVEGEKYEAELEHEAFSKAATQDWSLRVQGFILPGRQKIVEDHFPSLTDLQYLVLNNPFVPEGHEMIFLKGLYAGMHGDFLIASHLLVPQFENSIRNLLFIHGVDIRNLESDGTQPLKLLGACLGHPQAKSILGESLVFELRGALMEKSGFNFRNQVAHGFVSSAECNSIPGVLLWWLALRLCSFPIFASLSPSVVGAGRGQYLVRMTPEEKAELADQVQQSLESGTER